MALRSINSLNLFGIRKNCLISGRSHIIVPIYKMSIKLNSKYSAMVLLLTSYNILSIILSRLSPYI
jgi:hypothetical protein